MSRTIGNLLDKNNASLTELEASITSLEAKVDILNTKLDQLITLMGGGLPSTLAIDRLKISSV